MKSGSLFNILNAQLFFLQIFFSNQLCIANDFKNSNILENKVQENFISSKNNKNNRKDIINKIKEETGVYLFGNCLDKLLIENDFKIPENFLVNEMNLYFEINSENLKLTLYQEYDSKIIPLLETSVALGGKNKDYSTGRFRDFSTPKGDYFLKRIINRPQWFPPKWAKTKKPVKPSKNNPYGLWMSELSKNSEQGDYNWSISGDSKIRIHSTNKPNTIGSRSSHGCIRISPDVADELFQAILHYSSHKEPRKNSRGIIYPLEKPISMKIR